MKKRLNTIMTRDWKFDLTRNSSDKLKCKQAREFIAGKGTADSTFFFFEALGKKL